MRIKGKEEASEVRDRSNKMMRCGRRHDLTHHNAPTSDSWVGWYQLSPAVSIASGQMSCILRRMSALLINWMGSPVMGSLKEDVCAAAEDASPSRIVAATDILYRRCWPFIILIISSPCYNQLHRLHKSNPRPR